MAAEAERLTAHRTALLARCQAAREQRRRVEMIQARDRRDGVQAARDAAERALTDAAERRAAMLRARYDALVGGGPTGSPTGSPTGGTTGVEIRGLRGMEESLQRDRVRQQGTLRDADKALEEADAALQAAAQAFTAEAQRTRKRDKLAERCRHIYQRVLSAAEEAALEEELGDRLASVPSRA